MRRVGGSFKVGFEIIFALGPPLKLPRGWRRVGLGGVPKPQSGEMFIDNDHFNLYQIRLERNAEHFAQVGMVKSEGFPFDKHFVPNGTFPDRLSFGLCTD